MKPDDKRAAFPFFLIAAASAILLLQAVTLLLPWDRVWGFDMLRYLQTPEPFSYAFILGTAVLVVLWLTARDLPTPSYGYWLLLAALPLVALLLAPGVETFFYGDGALLIPQVHRYSVTGDFDRALLLNLKSSPLAGALLTLLMTTIPKLTTNLSTALYPFFWLAKLSLLAAGIAVAMLSRGPRRVYHITALAATAGVLLLMGEVEFYAPLFAAVAVYIVAGERAAREDAALWPAAVALLFAVAAHYMSIVLLPSLLFLAGRRRSVKLQSWKLEQGLIAGLVIIGSGQILYLIVEAIFPHNRILMPLSVLPSEAGVQHYTLFSFMHFADMLNLLLLLAPLALIALPLFWKRLLGGKKADAVSAYHALTTLPFLGFIFFMNASLGLARDWDLAAVLGIILLLAAMAAGERSRYRHAVPLLLALSMLVQLPWLLLHAQPQATAERFEKVMELDDENMIGDYALSGYDALRKFDFGQNDADREITLTRRMIVLVGYPQHYRELHALAKARYASTPDSLYAQELWMIERLTQQAAHLSSQNRSEGYAISLQQIDSLAQGIGLRAISAGRDAVVHPLSVITAITRDGTQYPSLEGLQQYRSRQYDAAAVSFRASLGEGFASPSLYLLLGNALALSGQYSASLARFEEGVRRYPRNGMLRFTLGKYYVRAGIQPQRAAELLLWCVEHDNPTEHVAEARALLGQLRR